MTATGARPPIGSRTSGTAPASVPVGGTGVATAPPGAAIATGALPEGATRMVWPT